MPLSQGSELTLFPAQFWLLCCQKRDSQQVRTCKGPSVKVLCFMIPSSVGQSVPLLRWSLMPAELWVDPWSSRWTAHRSQPPLAQRALPLPSRVPFRAEHGWLETLFVQWGNNHRVQKGELGNWECSDPSHLGAYNLKGSPEVSWQVPAEGNEVGCRHVGHPDKSGGVMCSTREEEMKMEFLYGHSLGWRAHSEASCRGNCLCAPFLLPLKKKQTLAKTLQDACCHLCIWDKPWHKASVSPSNSVWEATQHFAEVKQFSCISVAVSSILQNNEHQFHGRADTSADVFQNITGFRMF